LAALDCAIVRGCAGAFFWFAATCAAIAFFSLPVSSGFAACAAKVKPASIMPAKSRVDVPFIDGSP
jgi:hypothetical protein